MRNYNNLFSVHNADAECRPTASFNFVMNASCHCTGTVRASRPIIFFKSG